MRRRALLGLISIACHPSRAAEPKDDSAPAEAMVAAVARELEALDHAVDRDVLSIEIREPQRFVEQYDGVLSLESSDSWWAAMVAVRRAFAIEPEFADPSALRAEIAARRVKDLLAFYDPQRRAIVFRSDALPSADGLDLAVARALVHAFQDQRMGGLVASLLLPDGPADEARAQRCVLEGHAAFVAAQMRSIAPDDDPCTRFIRDAHARGGWPAVLRAVSSPPPSTEMLLHPNKLDVDFPVRVGLPEWEARGAKLVRDDTLGELELRALLQDRGWTAEEAYVAATGWDGDRMQVYALPDGTTLVLWRLLWDRELDGVQFRNALAPKKDAPPHFWRVAHRGRLVQAISAADEVTATALRDLLGGEMPPAEEPADVASTKEAESR